MRKLKNEELGRVSPEDFKSIDKNPVCLLLDNVRSLNNVGSAFRTSDAFLVDTIYLTGITGKPPHREINKTALGATETVNWVHFENPMACIEHLKSTGWTIVAVEQAEGSTSLSDFAPMPEGKYCFVFGNEVMGVAADVVETADLVLEIPQFGTKHSLNISVSIGIVLWDFLSKISSKSGNPLRG